LPVLPIIDLLILMGWSLLAVGAVLKAVAMTTAYRPSIANLGPMDFLTMAIVCLVFALALAARTWVKSHEPEMLARQRSVTGREPYRSEDYPARRAERGEAQGSRREGDEMVRPQGSV